MACFGDRVIEQIRTLGHPLCVGLDPYLGPASLEPFVAEAELAGRGVIVLVRNSSSDSSTYQSVATAGGPFFTVVATSLAPFQKRRAAGRQDGPH